MVKSFIGGFPLEITELELAKLVAPFGDIATVKIVRDKKTRKCKGYAFIKMLTAEGADEAIRELNNVEMEGRTLTVKTADPIAAPANPSVFKKPNTRFGTNLTINAKPVNEGRSKRPRRPLS
jgi:RNA recognition motif-containing protein